MTDRARLVSLPAPQRAAPGPLRRVIDALAAGATTRAELSARTGLPADAVDGAVEHLRRTGRLRSAAVGGCPTAGCGQCPSGRAEDASGCGFAAAR